METFSKGVALFFFAAGIILLILTLLNYGISFSAANWLGISFWRLYLFLAVTGILVYILIRFRRREGE
ncbi:putative membrane protein [Planomicrobium sp. HSC-17F08]|nr:putative membrane protein [Planomicrobium sp. HSC-17F08]